MDDDALNQNSESNTEDDFDEDADLISEKDSDEISEEDISEGDDSDTTSEASEPSEESDNTEESKTVEVSSKESKTVEVSAEQSIQESSFQPSSESEYDGGQSEQHNPDSKIKNRKYEKSDLMKDLNSIFISEVKKAYNNNWDEYYYFDTSLERIVPLHEMFILIANGVMLPSLVSMCSEMSPSDAYKAMWHVRTDLSHTKVKSLEKLDDGDEISEYLSE